MEDLKETWAALGKLLKTVLIIDGILVLLGFWKLIEIVIWIGKGLI